jgi:cytidine deaminase
MSVPIVWPTDRATIDSLVEAAQRAVERAYAPYSNYKVGAAVLTDEDDEEVFAAANVENASYGLSLCAERNALTAAISSGARSVVALVVATASSPPAAPCGACRQMLAEFAADTTPIVLVNPSGERVETSLGELLPRAFRLRDFLK